MTLMHRSARDFCLVILAVLTFAGGSYLATASAQESPRRALAEARSEERLILQELADLERELISVESEIDTLRERANESERLRVVHSDELAATTASLSHLRQEIGTRTRALYRLNRRGFARVVFSSDDPREVQRTSHYLMAVLREDEGRTDRIVEQVRIKQGALDRLAADNEAISAVGAELRLREAELRDSRARRVAILSDVQERRELAQAALEQRSEGRSQINDYVVSPSETPSSFVTENSGDGTRSFRESAGSLPWPTTGTLMRGYGRSVNPATGVIEPNDGIDIQAAFGTPTRAVAEGIVKHTGYVNGFGLVVVLEHGPYATVYAHLGRIQVSRGAHVEEGDLVGLVGETGTTDGLGSRLHFEVRYNESPQDPMQWLTRRSRGRP
jgi:murein hydrolase activator